MALHRHNESKEKTYHSKVNIISERRAATAARRFFSLEFYLFRIGIALFSALPLHYIIDRFGRFLLNGFGLFRRLFQGLKTEICEFYYVHENKTKEKS